MKKTISFNKTIDFPTMIGEVTAISLDHNLKFIDESNITGDLKITGRYKMTEASRLEEDFDHQLPVEIILTEKLDLETAKVDVEDFYYEIENDDTMTCYIDIKVEGVEVVEELEQEDQNLIDIEEIKKVEDYKEEVVEAQDRCLETENDTPTIEPIIEEPEVPGTSLEEENRECDGEDNGEMESVEMENIEIKKVEMENVKMAKVEDLNPEVLELNQGVGSLFSSFKDSDETFATYSVYILRQEETIQTIIEKYKITKEELEKYNDLTNLSIGTKIIIPTTNE